MADDLHEVFPAREPKNHKDRLSTSGAYWSSTARDLVFYESLIEREMILLSDFDPNVIELIAQPFRMIGILDGQRKVHTPDYARITRDGGIHVINCKPQARLAKDTNVILHAWAERTLGQAGISHQVATEMSTVRARNMSSLAHLRNDRWVQGLPLDSVEAACSTRMTIQDLLDACSPAMTEETGIACIRALLWRHRLHTDLDVLLSTQSTVWPSNV